MPYAENDGRGKDRPVLVIGRMDDSHVYAVRLTSRSHDGDRDFLAIGAGPWDVRGGPRGSTSSSSTRCTRADCAERRAHSTAERFADEWPTRCTDATAGPWRGDARKAWSGRYRTRTDDLFRVKEARYQLRQSPNAPWGRVTILPDARVAHESGSRDTRGRLSVLHLGDDRIKSLKRRRDPDNADVAQLVAHNLAKVGVASSSLVIRSSAGIATRKSTRIPESRSRHVGQPHMVAWPSG